jgi:ankyrin repeat protein
LLEFGANNRILDQDSQKAIDIAILKRNILLVQVLGNTKYRNRETVLYLAVAKGYFNIVCLLLNSGIY